MTDYRTEPAYVETNSRIDKIEVTLSHAVDAIEKITTVVNRPQQTQWGPILTAVGLLLIIGGGYTTLVTQPIINEANKTRSKLELHEQRAYENHIKTAHDVGVIQGKLEVLKEQRENEARDDG